MASLLAVMLVAVMVLNTAGQLVDQMALKTGDM
jgi:hypothetical protein